MVKELYKFTFGFFILLGVFLSQAFVNVDSYVSKNPVGVEEVFDLIVEVTSDEKVEIHSAPVLPTSLENFIFRSSQTSSQTIQKYDSVTGSIREFRTVFYFTLLASEEGTWSLPSMELVINQKSYKTQKVDVEVSGSISSQNSPPFDKRDPFGVFDNFFKENLEPFQNEGELKIQVVAPKKKIYLGEMLPVDWYLYKEKNFNSPIAIQEYSNIQPKNFWLHKVKDISNLEFDKVVQEGETLYLRGLLASYVLFPLRTGSLTVDPFEVQFSVSDFSSFFSRKNSVRVSSRALDIEVVNLPQAQKGNFTGAVGEFLIRSEVASNSINASDLLSYKIYFEGRGGVQGIQIPEWPQDSDFEVYNIMESQDFSLRKSTKTFEVLLVPKTLGKSSGVLKTPSFQWTTFDPGLESYVEHELPSYEIQIQEGALVQEGQGESFLGKVQEGSPLSTSEGVIQKFIYKYFWFIFAFLFLVVSGVFYRFFWVRYQFLFLKKNHSRALKNFGKTLFKGCTQARHLKNKKLYSEVGVLLLKIIDQIWLSLTGVMGRDLDILLEKCPPSVRLEMGEKMETLIEKLEFLSFAPKEAHDWSEEDVEKIIQETEILISRFLKYYR